MHENLLRKWMRELAADPRQALPGKGVMKSERAKLERLQKESTKLRIDRDILKKNRGRLLEGVDVKFGFVAKY